MASVVILSVHCLGNSTVNHGFKFRICLSKRCLCLGNSLTGGQGWSEIHTLYHKFRAKCLWGGSLATVLRAEDYHVRPLTEIKINKIKISNRVSSARIRESDSNPRPPRTRGRKEENEKIAEEIKYRKKIEAALTIKKH